MLSFLSWLMKGLELEPDIIEIEPEKKMFEMAPEPIRACQHFMKLAADHDQRNIVVAYYARMSAIQLALKIFPNEKPPEVTEYLTKVMEWLETAKQEHKDVEGITNETVASAVIEEYLLRLYKMAYYADSHAKFDRNMVKFYYTTTLLCDILRQFGPLTDDLDEKYKISKYRAAYLHNMLKQGLKPQGINTVVVHGEEEEGKHLISLEQLNERRIARGEDPLPVPQVPPKGPVVRLPDPVEPNKDDMMPPERIVDVDESKNDDIIEMAQNLPRDPFTAALYHYRKLHPVTDEEEAKPKTARHFFKPTYPPSTPSLEDDEDDIWRSIKPKPKPAAAGGPSTSQQPDTGDANTGSIDSIAPQDSPTSPPVVNAPPTTPTLTHTASDGSALDPDKVEKAMKYCKWASSALNYDDMNTAIANLEKALNLCKFGKENP